MVANMDSPFCTKKTILSLKFYDSNYCQWKYGSMSEYWYKGSYAELVLVQW